MKITIEFDKMDSAALAVLRALANLPPDGTVICSGPPEEVPITVWASSDKLDEAKANMPISDNPAVTVKTEAIPEAPPLVEVLKPTPKPKKEKKVEPEAPAPTVEAPPAEDLTALQQTVRGLVMKMVDDHSVPMQEAVKKVCDAMGVPALRGTNAEQLKTGIAFAEKFLAEAGGSNSPPDVLDAMFA